MEARANRIRVILHLLALSSSLALMSCASAPTISASCSQTKDYKAKLQTCTTDVQSNPRNDLAHDFLSLALLHYGRYEDALQNINTAIEINPKEGWYYVVRCHVKTALTQYSDALQDCSTAIKLINNRQDYYVYRDSGTLNYYLGNYSAAKSDFDSAIEANSDDVNSYAWRCKILFIMSDYQNALDSCDRYLKISQNENDGDYLWIMEYTGASHYQLKQYDLARPYAAWILQHVPNKTIHYSESNELEIFNLDARREKVRNLTVQADIQQSSGNLENAFALYNDAAAYVSGLTPTDEKMTNDVIADLFKLYPRLSVKPPLPELARQYQVEGDTYFKNNDYADAIRAYRLAYSCASWYPALSYNLALLYAQQKDFHDAIGYMNAYIRLAPDAPDAKQAQDKIYEWNADAGLTN